MAIRTLLVVLLILALTPLAAANATAPVISDEMGRHLPLTFPYEDPYDYIDPPYFPRSEHYDIFIDYPYRAPPWVPPGISRPRGCQVQSGYTFLADLDCDGIPDGADNCKAIHNPDQADSNRNGIGDGCDLVIERIDVDPRPIQDGRPFEVAIKLVNHRAEPIHNVAANLLIGELGVRRATMIGTIEPYSIKEVRFIQRGAPCPEPGLHELAVRITMPHLSGQRGWIDASVPIEALASPLCDATHNYSEPPTIVDIIEIQDVRAGESATFPFTITNHQGRDAAYTMTLRGLEPWAGYTIEPGALILVESGESRGGELRMHVSEQAPPGPYSFIVEVASEEETTQRLLVARIQQEPAPAWQRWWPVALAGLVFVLILYAVIISLQRLKARQTRRRRR